MEHQIMRIIGKARFDHYESYIFGNRLSDSCEIHFFKDSFVYKEGDNNKKCRVILANLSNIANENGALNFETYVVHKGYMKKVMDENVWLQYFANGLVIWSCKNILDGKSDQAVLILSTSDVTAINDVRSAASQFLNKNLRDGIFWESINVTFCWSEICMGHRDLPGEVLILPRFQNPISYVVPGVLLIYLVVVVIVTFKTFGKNRVHHFIE